MTPIVNGLLEDFPRNDLARLLRHCEAVELNFGTVLCEAEQAFTYVYFPLKGFIALVATLRKHHPLEMGLIGNEGMLGATLVLGVDAVPMQAVVQGEGSFLRMARADFQRELQACPTLRRKIQQYLYVVIAQLAQTGACSHFHAIEPRMARWSLMSHDRANADHFHLTQEYLTHMLGVRRSGITVAVGTLQSKKLIDYSRGEIRILNREGLESEACE